ncbi:permease-like cell division protein FtsX [Brevibacillus dissolubilis]|uniref:permease-like cell division protein FtsX n=1 Tax=Brevibacillus dissolubilis TaxID=1844116 RepID=UPI0011172B1C|nr:permease-like cell division protein FtsX [Brevibacillus dissolubilis]
MKIRTLGRHVREGAKNLGRNGWMTFASVSAVSITLLILGVFLILALNVNHIAQTVEKQVEIRVFLDVLADKTIATQVQDQIEANPKVDTVTFISKEEGLEQLKKRFGQNAKLLEGLEDDNPLPDTLVVKAKVPSETASIAKEVKGLEHVEDVSYGEGTVEKLFTATAAIRNVGIIFIVGLAFTAMFLIANTIRLTIMARRREIEIMKLVGATNWFIRWPFFVEGLLMGSIGALIPIVILTGGYYYLVDKVNTSMTVVFFSLLPMNPLSYQVALILISIGAFIGIWGSMISVRRFLRV